MLYVTRAYVLPLFPVYCISPITLSETRCSGCEMVFCWYSLSIYTISEAQTIVLIVSFAV